MPPPTTIYSLPFRFPSHPLHFPRRHSSHAPLPRLTIRSLDTRVDPNPDAPQPRTCLCCTGLGRRSLLLGGPLMASVPPPDARASVAPSDPLVLADGTGLANRPSRPEWYQAIFARVMHWSTGFSESKLAKHKSEIFEQLSLEDKDVLEIGIGTGPNFKYYANARVYGVDPNKQMEKYVREAAALSGLPPENFHFLQGIAEALPVRDNSMDAVIATLVLCSVDDVDATLREVKRVLKPGGIFVFMEHVAARDGSFVRLIQTVLDPVQQFMADGCHLARPTGKNISEAGFSNVQISMSYNPNMFIFGSLVYGFACK